ncbi:hypothetical protein KL859_10840 [Mycolicibacterium goodii]|uniref:DUF6542 domain-containing protein n=1 Tax=Mycolicibacterium goodii TaxID=134601 RepID=A0ABS6HMC4_MYCGD|nr:hypothetical protein [Mycolicibacterium goodii]MBU8835583.1 hypothetical protein [Mycolicibacterium goodii]
MFGQRAESAVPADLRSVHPRYAGVPWWGAVLLAVTATAIGFAFDAGSGSRELSGVFAFCYVVGCLAAVAAVRQSGVFTAVIQPPLILFFAVPGSYFLFHGGELSGLKDLAINCGYPLIERFPLMLFTSAAVLLVGLGRWYVGLTHRDTADDGPPASSAGKRAAGEASNPLVASITSKLSALLFRKPATDRSASRQRAKQTARRDRSERAEAGAAPRKRTGERPPRRRQAGAGTAEAREGATTRNGRPTKRTAAPRSRRPRGADLDPTLEGTSERPRRPRPPRAEPPLVPPAEPRRRVRTQPREPREPRKSSERLSAYERPQRRRRFDDYEPFEDPFDAPFEPPFEPRTNGHPGRSTHHPVSRVRYRGGEDEDHRSEYRTRPRPASRGRHSRDS